LSLGAPYLVNARNYLNKAHGLLYVMHYSGEAPRTAYLATSQRPRKSRSPAQEMRARSLIFYFRSAKGWVSLPKEDEISWLQSVAQLPLRATCAGLLVLVIASRPVSTASTPIPTCGSDH
jgi:hypothetical protein